MYDARVIANWFISRATQDEKIIDLIKLMKIVYIANGWHLEITGRPLISNTIEAWSSGPIIPSLYKAFKDQGVEVRTTDLRFSSSVNNRVAGFLEEIFSIYGALSTHQLRKYTCALDGPWHTTLMKSGLYMPIPNSVILANFREFRASQRARDKSMTLNSSSS